MVIIYYSKGKKDILGITHYNSGYYEDAIRFAEENASKHNAYYFDVFDNDTYYNVIRPLKFKY